MASHELKDDSAPQIDPNDLFSTRRPKDARAGLSSGLKSISKGVLAGGIGLIAAPVVGARSGGVVGLAKGLVAGVAGAVIMPVAGVAVGTVQICRGVANQPEASRQAAQGKIWDQESRSWIDKPDGTIVTAESAKQAQDRVQGVIRRAQGDDYYELLQVAPDASPEQIKKQYYILAKKWHPDKNPDDASAGEKFQKLGEAYQVLGNPELRAKYDQGGKEGLDVDFMDGGSFFNMLFGGDQFQHLIGELVIAAAARSGGKIDSGKIKRAQQARVDQLAMGLRNRLAKYVQGDEAGFKAAAQEEADKLVRASFGETLLNAIGRVYVQQADIALSGFFGGIAAKLKASNENVKSQFQAVNAAMKLQSVQQKMEDWQAQHPDKKGAEQGEEEAAQSDGTQLTPEELAERQRLEDEAVPLVLAAMWAANVMDIKTTLAQVCTKVLEDKAVPKAELKLRAQALMEIGVIFSKVKASGSVIISKMPTSAEAARQHMEEALLRAKDKQAGFTSEE